MRANTASHPAASSKPKPRKTRMLRSHKSGVNRIRNKIDVIPPRMRLLPPVVKRTGAGRIPHIRHHQKTTRRSPAARMIEIAKTADPRVRIMITVRCDLHHPKRRKYAGKRSSVRLPHRRSHRLGRSDQRVDGIRRTNRRHTTSETLRKPIRLRKTTLRRKKKKKTGNPSHAIEFRKFTHSMRKNCKRLRTKTIGLTQISFKRLHKKQHPANVISINGLRGVM